MYNYLSEQSDNKQRQVNTLLRSVDQADYDLYVELNERHSVLEDALMAELKTFKGRDGRKSFATANNLFMRLGPIMVAFERDDEREEEPEVAELEG